MRRPGAATAGKQIGVVSSLTGEASATRTDGTVVTLKVDDVLFQGDVLQTGAGAKMGATFLDGTVFSLSADARMVLNNLVYDPAILVSGSSTNEMLFTLVDGTFAFVAGKVAPTGDMQIVTPVATMGIRGTFSIASIQTVDGVPRATFAVAPEIKNGVVVVGSFEVRDLVSNKLLAVINKVGTTWQVTRTDTGTEAQAEQTTASGASDADKAAAAAAIAQITADLKVAYANAKAKYLDGEGKLIQPEAGTGTETEEAGAEAPAAQIASAQIASPIGTDAIVSLDASASAQLAASIGLEGGLADTFFDALFQLISQIVVVDVLAGTAGPSVVVVSTPPPDTTPGGVNPPTLPVATPDTNTGNPVVEGTNALATGNVVLNDTPTGSVTVTQVTNSAGTVGVVDGTTPLAGTYGLLTIAANGVWSYELTAGDAVPAALPGGGPVVDTFGYAVSNSAGFDTATLSITITGVNDIPTVAAPLVQTAAEAVATFTADLLAGASDLDAGETATLAVTNVTYAVDGGPASATAPAGLSLTGSVLTIDPTSTAFNPLAVGAVQTIVVSYFIQDAQGATVSQTETITITGTNDAPTVSATAAAGFTEALDASAQDLSDSGTVSFDDIDTNDVVDITFASNGTPVWSGGTIDAALAAQLVAGFSTGVLDAAAPGSTPWSYSVTGANLDFLAATETITFSYTVTATDSQGATATDTVSFTITGTTDATVSISDGTPNPATEGTDASISFTVTLSAATNEDTVVTYSTVNGSAVAGTDFTGATNATITIPAGATSATIIIPVVDNAIVENAETFNVVLSAAQLVNSNGALVITDATGAATITDNDATSLDISVAPPTIAEGAELNTITFTVTRTGNAEGDQSVDYTLTGVEASDLAPATPFSGTLTFATGETTKTITVVVADDALDEVTETLTATLSNAQGSAVNPAPTINTATASATITDNDQSVSFSIAADVPSISEEDGASATFTISTTGFPLTTGNTATVALAVTGTADGSDYTPAFLAALEAALPAGVTLSGSTLTFTAAYQGGDIVFSVAAVDDDIVEGDQTIIATLSLPTVSNGTAVLDTATDTVTITDVDQDITITIADTQTSISEEAGGTDTFTITLSQAINTGNTVTVDVDFATGTTTEDADFVTAAQAALQAIADATAGVSFDGTTLTFDDTFVGTTLSFSVTAANDDLTDSPETLNVTLSNATAVNGTATAAELGRCDVTDVDQDITITIADTQTSISEEAGGTDTFTHHAEPGDQHRQHRDGGCGLCHRHHDRGCGLCDRGSGGAAGGRGCDRGRELRRHHADLRRHVRRHHVELQRDGGRR